MFDDKLVANAEQILLKAFDFFNGLLNDCNIFNDFDFDPTAEVDQSSTALKDWVESTLLSETMTIAYLSKLTKSYLALT